MSLWKTSLIAVMLCVALTTELFAPVQTKFGYQRVHYEVAPWVKRYRISPQLATTILVTADRYEIPHRIAMRLVHRESGFCTTAVGAAGEVGLTQVLPSTARMLGYTPAELHKPATGLDAGFKYLHQLHGRYRGWSRALVAYNQGPRVANEQAVSEYSLAILGGRP